MKYTYIYKTSDGVRHEASMNAESRDKVFETLRGQGIRAIKVIAADGSKANGEIRGVRKRIVFLVAGVAAVLAGLVVFVAGNMSGSSLEKNAGLLIKAQPLPRQELKGDRKRVEEARTCFTLKAEAFLAKYAEPGRPVNVLESDWPSKADFDAACAHDLTYEANEFTEQIDLKRIVSWLKREYARYVRGGGYASGYIKGLTKRQAQEVDMREKHIAKLHEILSKRDIRDEDKTLAKAYRYWLEANAQLFAAGIYSIPIPYVLENYQSAHAVPED